MSVIKKVLGGAARSPSARVSFENYEDGITPEELAQAQQLELAQTTAMEELNELSNEILVEGQEGELLSEAVDTYPRVVEMIEQDIEQNGGVSTESAKYLNFILDSAGLNGLVNISVESFADNQSRLGATRVSLEGLKETLRNWWENLLNWFKRMREKLKKWWIKNFSTAAAIKSRAANIGDRAKKISTTKVKEKRISFPRLQSTLMTAGKVDSNSIISGITTATQLGDKIFSTWQEPSIQVAESILDVVESAQMDANGVVALGTEIVTQLKGTNANTPEGLGPVSGDVPDAYGKDTNSNFTVLMSAQLPGQKALFMRQRVDSPDGVGLEGLQNAVDWLATRSFKLDSALKKTVDDRDTQIETLSARNIETIAGLIEDFAAVIENYQRNFKKQEDANANIDKFRKIADQATDDNDTGVVKAQNLLKKMPNALRDMINEPVNGYAAYFNTLANAALNVCERSLAQY